MANDRDVAATRGNAWLDMLQQTCRSLERSIGDVAAFGPWLADHEPEAALAVAGRVGELQAAAHALGASLNGCRQRYLAAQLDALGITSTQQGLRLHIGSGPTRVPGWINIDLHPAELALDLRWGLPFADGSVNLVYSAHCLEHQYLADGLHTLREIHRVLEPGGRARLIVPDMEAYARAYVEDDAEFFAARREVWRWVPEGLTPLMTVLGNGGAGARGADAGERHKYGYDFVTLAAMLQRAGFAQIERVSFMAGATAELLLDEHSAVAGASHRGRHYSLFVEAAKQRDGGGTA